MLKHILEGQVRGKGDGVSDAPRAACLPPLLTTPACVSPWHLAGDLDEKGRAFLAAIDPEDVGVREPGEAEQRHGGGGELGARLT